MAIKATVETPHGDERELYIRAIHVHAINHAGGSHALFRGFASEDAFKAGRHFLWEQEVEFNADVSKPLWEQAYAALQGHVGGGVAV